MDTSHHVGVFESTRNGSALGSLLLIHRRSLVCGLVIRGRWFTGTGSW